jgi:hypothetical protein
MGKDEPGVDDSRRQRERYYGHVMDEETALREKRARPCYKILRTIESHNVMHLRHFSQHGSGKSGAAGKVNGCSRMSGKKVRNQPNDQGIKEPGDFFKRSTACFPSPNVYFIGHPHILIMRAS